VAPPPCLKFKYQPSQPYTPIHEATVATSASWSSTGGFWFSDNENPPELNVRGTFTGLEDRTDEVKTNGFRHCQRLTGMKATFPSIIDGDLLQLIHLSNCFKVVPGHKRLKVGDICNGCRWRLRQDCQRGLISREGKLVIEVQSIFLFRSCFTNLENIFEIVDELITLSLPPTSASCCLRIGSFGPTD
jgi:fatty acid synthase subunit alpha, fungi type